MRRRAIGVPLAWLLALVSAWPQAGAHAQAPAPAAPQQLAASPAASPAVSPAAAASQAAAPAGATPPGAAPAAASPPAARRAATSPLASSMQARKVVAEGGRESLEDAANVTIGDVIQYTAQHRNVSQRRLLRIDFGIPIPPGTSYVEGSASPDGARRVTLDKRRDQMLWRVERLDPGEEVTLSLRVKIDPDPLLTPVPDGPRKPELRRSPDTAR